ncbi:MAG: DUF3795 domain-containing protein [Dehalococcoidales bacterium]
MSEIELVAACGLYCGDCEYIGDKCPGCGRIQGRPFWTELFKLEACPLYDCCVNQHHLEHCGLCDEFPCETFTSLRDPSMNDEEAEQSWREKKQVLLLRKEIGTEAWLRQKL